MSNSNFRKACSQRVKRKQTEVMAPNFHFSVVGKIKNLDHFKELYLEERSKMTYNENCFVDGIYDKTKDYGYLNLLKILESDSYQIREFDYDYTYRVPATLKCCDVWMKLSRFTNTCSKCGTDYNSSGQQLADRSLWGEETGEHWSECY
jgi:hypothetical protein